MIYTSNLVIGLEKGLDDPAFLKRAADETGTGVELFLHTHDTAYLRNMEKAAQWLWGQAPHYARPFYRRGGGFSQRVAGARAFFGSVPLCVSNGPDAAQSAYGVSYPSEGDSGG